MPTMAYCRPLVSKSKAVSYTHLVVMLKAAGTRISWAPRSPMTRKNSAKRISKQMALSLIHI